MANSMDLQSLGKVRLNPLAGKTNLWKLTTDLCECTTEATCMDWVTIDLDPARTFASIVWNGITINFDDVSSADLTAVKEAIESALSPYENNPYIEFVTGATTAAVIFKHYGAGTLSSINFASGSPATTARVCTQQLFCTFEGSDSGAVTPLSITKHDGTTASVSVAGGPFAYVGNSGTDATTAASFATALYNALSGAGYVGVDAIADGDNAITVTVNDTDETFDIVLPRLRNVKSLVITGTTFTKTECVNDFAAI